MAITRTKKEDDAPKIKAPVNYYTFDGRKLISSSDREGMEKASKAVVSKQPASTSKTTPK